MENKKVKNKIAECLAESNVISEDSTMLNACEINDDIKTDFLERKNIINLNSDCMELIFEHLEFNDLLNVTDSSKHFYTATNQVYKRKYTNMNPIYVHLFTPR